MSIPTAAEHYNATGRCRSRAKSTSSWSSARRWPVRWNCPRSPDHDRRSPRCARCKSYGHSVAARSGRHHVPEAFAPAHVELTHVLWEMGRCTDVRYLGPTRVPPDIAGSTPEEVIEKAVARFGVEQWTHWPLTDALDKRLREVLRTRFDELFVATPSGFGPGWINVGHEVLLTWEPGMRR